LAKRAVDNETAERHHPTGGAWMDWIGFREHSLAVWIVVFESRLFTLWHLELVTDGGGE
jgi:hypothetical protein